MNQPSIDHILCACLQVAPAADIQPKLARWRAAEWAHLLTVARRQRVAPLLYERLKMHGWLALVPPAVQTQLYTAYYKNCLRNLQLYQQLALIIDRLQAQTIPAVVLKGGMLAATIYADPSLRVMNDLDLLVPRPQLPAAVAVMQELGYTFLEEPTATDLTQRHHLPRLVQADGVTEVELHWTITPPGRYHPVDTAVLWARAVTVEVAGMTIRVLSPTDQLLHLCLHASYHHSFQQGMRFLCDVDALLRRQGERIDWNALQQQTQQQGWGHGVYLVLYLASQLLVAPVSSAVLQALKPIDFSAEEVELACWHMFAQEKATSTLSPAVVELWQASSVWQRFILLGQRLSVQRAFLAHTHKVAPAHLRLHHYLHYYGGMVQRYIGHLWLFARGDDRPWVATKRHMALTEMLGGAPSSRTGRRKG